MSGETIGASGYTDSTEAGLPNTPASVFLGFPASGFVTTASDGGVPSTTVSAAMSQEHVDAVRMDELDLLDWKRRVFELYARIRETPDPEGGWRDWCEARARLFREHPQSPVPAGERGSFEGPFVYDYDPAWRLSAEVEPMAVERLELPSSD